MIMCKHTKDGHGYYVKIVEAYRMYYNPDGTPSGTDDGVNSSGGRGGTIAYCENCDRRIGKVKWSSGRVVIDATDY